MNSHLLQGLAAVLHVLARPRHLLLPGHRHRRHDLLVLGEFLQQLLGVDVLLVGQHLPQHLHLCPQLPDDLGVLVLVDDGVVGDPLGPVRVPQGGESLLVVIVSGGDGGHHHSPGVAPEVVLQQPGERGVSVGDEGVFGLAVGQLGDDEAEGGEGLVDVGALLQSLPLGPGLVGSLRPGKVDQGDSGDLHSLHSAVSVTDRQAQQ